MTTPPSRRSARPFAPSRSTQQRVQAVAGVLGLATVVCLSAFLTPQAATAASPARVVQVAEATHPLDRQLEQATDGLGPSTATAAIYAEYEAKWDAELNRVYRLLLAELSLGEQAALREAQRAWLKSRDADGRIIDALYRPDGRGVPTMIISAHAYARMNLTRVRALCLIRWRERHAEIGAELAEAPEPSAP